MQDGISGSIPQYPIESVDRTLRLLAHLAECSELKLSEVRTYLEVGQSTAHRLMAMLVYRGFAVQDPETRVYRVGPALFEIARAGGDFDIGRSTRPILEWLAGQSGETAHFGVLTGTEVRYIDVVESTSVLRVTGRVGQLNPAHATSLGKAMLSTLHDAARPRALRRMRDDSANGAQHHRPRPPPPRPGFHAEPRVGAQPRGNAGRRLLCRRCGRASGS